MRACEVGCSGGLLCMGSSSQATPHVLRARPAQPAQPTDRRFSRAAAVPSRSPTEHSSRARMLCDRAGSLPEARRPRWSTARDRATSSASRPGAAPRARAPDVGARSRPASVGSAGRARRARSVDLRRSRPTLAQVRPRPSHVWRGICQVWGDAISTGFGQHLAKIATKAGKLAPISTDSV